MQKTLPEKSVSVTELQNPEKVLAEAGGGPVAVMRNGEVVGYFVPKSAVEQPTFEYMDSAELDRILEENKAKHQPVLDYLQDK